MEEISTTIITSMHNRNKNVLEIIDNLFFPSLLNNGSKEMELILIDDYSPLKIETEKIVAKYLPNLKNVFGSVIFKRNTLNLGFAKSYNRGINMAKGKYLLIVNDDVYFPMNSIKKLTDTLSEPGNYGLAGPITNTPNSWSFQYCKQAPRIKSYSQETIKKIEQFSIWLAEKMKEKRMPTENLSGFCFAIDAVLFKKMGGFKENYKYGYFEDTDLFRRINNEYGKEKIVINMEIFIVHGGVGGSSATFTQQPLKTVYYFLTNSLKYGKKWGYGNLIKRIIYGLRSRSGKGTISELL